MTNSLAPHEIENSTNEHQAGVKSLDTQPYYAGASNARQNAIISADKNNEHQHKLNQQAGKGGKHNYYHLAGGDSNQRLIVPKFPASGAGGMAPNQGANASSASVNSTAVQGGAFGICDSCAVNPNTVTCQGPSCNSQTGGSSGCSTISTNQTWSCMSGGRKTKKNKKTKKVAKKSSIKKSLKNTSNKKCYTSKCCPHMPTTNGKHAHGKTSHMIHFKKQKYKFYTCCKECGTQMKKVLKTDPKKFEKIYISGYDKRKNLLLKHRFTKKIVQIGKKVVKKTKNKK